MREVLPGTSFLLLGEGSHSSLVAMTGVVASQPQWYSESVTVEIFFRRNVNTTLPYTVAQQVLRTLCIGYCELQGRGGREGGRKGRGKGGREGGWEGGRKGRGKGGREGGREQRDSGGERSHNLRSEIPACDVPYGVIRGSSSSETTSHSAK